MTIFEAVILGLVQAAGEFFPVSSSAHLALMPWLTGAQYQGVTFDVFLHLATLAALLFYFRKDWFEIIKNGLTKPTMSDGKILWLLVLATLPAAVAGVVFKDYIETVFRHPLMIAGALVLFALVLFYADKKSSKSGNFLTLRTALIIGCAQALALMPGVSRSGITITAALMLGFTRKESARISFLLSAPVIAGAAALELRHVAVADINAAFVCGFLTAMITGWFAIKFLMSYVQKHNFNVFVIYRALVGLAIIAVYLARY